MDPSPKDKLFSKTNLAYPPSYISRYSDQYAADRDLPLEQNSETFSEHARLLLQNKGLLTLAALCGMIVAFLLTLPQHPRYRARTVLEIQNVNSDFLNTKQINPVAEDASSSNAGVDIQTQLNLIGSEHLLDRVFEKLHKDAPPPSKIVRTNISALKTILHLPVSPEPDPQDSFHQDALKNLKIQQMGQTRVIEMLYTSEDPKFAADFLNTLSSEYIEDALQARLKMNERTGQWLSRQLNEMRSKLKESEDALQTYARTSGLLFTGSTSETADKTNVSEEKLQQLQDALSKSQADRILAQSKYETAKDSSPETLADVLDDVSLRSLQEKLTDLRRQEAELMTTYTSRHEKVLRVQAQIPPLELAFNRQRAGVLDRVKGDFVAASRRETLLRTAFAAQAAVVTAQADKSILYNMMKHEVDSNRQIFESTLQQVREASVASTLRASNVQIVDIAKIPKEPYSPSFPLNCGLGSIVGLMIGTVFVVARQRTDRTLRNPGDTQFWTSLPELGVIPSVVVPRGRLFARNALSQLQITPNDEKIEGDVLVLQDPKVRRRASLLAESFRTVVTSILLADESATRPQVLVITSASAMDGKTTMVSNLAVAIAEIGRKLLVIDADLRRPRLHKLFNIPNDRGLSTIMREGLPADRDCSHFVHATSVPGLSILPSGPTTTAAVTLLHSPHLPELLARLRSRFDMILIDTPPALDMADARIVARSADAVVFIARAGRTTRYAVLAAQQKFAEDRTKILGTILNDWNPDKAASTYYGYSGRSHYQLDQGNEGRE